MPEITQDQYDSLIAAGHIEVADDLDADLDDDDDEDKDQSPVTAAKPPTVNPAEVQAARADLLEQARAFEEKGDWASAGILKSQAYLADDSRFVAPVAALPEQIAPEALQGEITKAEQSKDWERSLALKTRQLLGAN